MRPQSALTLAIAATLALAGCTRDAAPAAEQPAPRPAAAAPAAAAEQVVDEHSYSEPDRVQTTNLALDLAIDFDNKQIAGTATYALDWKDGAATALVLDTRGIDVRKAEGLGADGQWKELKFALAPADPILGSKLTIDTPERPAQVRVTYATAPDASGLQWLEPSMTEGKKLPFMFSQSQQIHARSWIPMQDTPRIRFTYTANVKAPADVMVLMSADNDPAAARDGEYSFKMPQAIPSYLMAIAAGDLVYQGISARSGVWAEPAMAPKAAAEFADTEKMIVAAEQLYGPYRWERYDILVLPPSFPYGGMENPRLTFATPTVVTGDKSLVALIAHELAHSWSGNLVTFAVDRDAWINEGFTSYVEARILEALYGRELPDMEMITAREELKREYAQIDPKLQVLALKPGDLPDPDNSSSATVYTKGAWFLQWLEQTYGREAFDPFLRAYFDQFAFQSMTTAKFREYLKANLVDKFPGKATMEQVDAWLYQPGIPEGAPQLRSGRLSNVSSARIAWEGSGNLPAPALSSNWTTQEWVSFLEGLDGKVLSHDQLRQLDEAYRFTGTPNGEIAQRWYPLAERSGYSEARAEMGKFLQRVGRRKLIMPTYEALAKTPDGLAFAREVFARARPGYHPITTGSVERVINQAQPQAPAPAADGASVPATAPATPASSSPGTPAQAPARPTVVGPAGKAPPIEDPATPPPAPTR